jgi:hypothetical protein
VSTDRHGIEHGAEALPIEPRHRLFGFRYNRDAPAAPHNITGRHPPTSRPKRSEASPLHLARVRDRVQVQRRVQPSHAYSLECAPFPRLSQERNALARSAMCGHFAHADV